MKVNPGVLLAFGLMAIQLPLLGQSVAINDNGSAPAVSAILDVNFFGNPRKGVLISRMTTAQRTAIAAPATSLLVFDTQTNSFWYYGGSSWIELVNVNSNLWQQAGNDIYNSNTGNVGVGTGANVKATFNVRNGGTVVFGLDSNSVNGSRFWFSGVKNALRIGTYSNPGFNLDAWDYANIGVNSVAFGTNNKSTGNGSFAAGDYNQTLGEGASSLGWLNLSSGRGSFATGYLNYALADWSQSMGYNNVANNPFSTAAGYGTRTWGEASFTHGTEIFSNSENMFTVGRSNDTSQYALASKTSWVGSDPLFVIGNGQFSASPSNAVIVLKDGRTGIGNSKPLAPFHVAANKSVIFGNDSLSSTTGQKFIWFAGRGALRFGKLDLGGGNSWDYANIGVNSLAIGEGARASGPQSFSQGYFSNATGYYSFARGFAASANGDHSMAFGQNMTVNGLRGIGMGENINSDGDWSFTYGNNNTVTGDFSGSFGQNLSARPYNAFVIGRFNDSVIGSSNNSWVAADPLFIIGNGSSNFARSNAVTVLKSGNFGISNGNPTALLHVGNSQGARIRFGTFESFEDFGANTIGASGSILPTQDNIYSLGSGSNRWTTVFATNGAINTSDRRDKRNIQKLEYGIEALMQLRPVRFEWISDLAGDGAKLGLIAQEVEAVIPEVVKKYEMQKIDEATGTMQKVALSRMGIYYSDLIPVLIQAIQDQQGIISAQRQKLEDLEKRLAAIEAKLK